MDPPSTTIASATGMVTGSTGGFCRSSDSATHRATSGVDAKYSTTRLVTVSPHANRASLGRLPRRHARNIRNTPSASATINTLDGMKNVDHQRVATRFIVIAYCRG